MKRSMSLVPVVVALGLAGAPLHAELQQGRSEQGHPFVAGGIGDAEQQAIQQVASDYSLQLVVANESGAYLADTAVRITNAQGDVVMAGHLEAPFLMVDLPPGRYTVEAQAEGKQLRRQVAVPGSGSRRIVLRF